jgi:hypothetical protein
MQGAASHLSARCIAAELDLSAYGSLLIRRETSRFI